MAIIADNLDQCIDLINTTFEEFTNESQAYILKGNKSANRRARLASLELRDLLKQFKALSVESDKTVKSE